METLKRNIWVLVSFVVAIGIVAGAFRMANGPVQRTVFFTNGEVQTVHADVKVGGRDVRGTARFAIGEPIETSADGRGRLRLDDGTVLILGRSTKVVAAQQGVTLEAGQLFVQGAPGAPTQITSGGATAMVAGSTVAIDKTPEGAKFYCANGELLVRGAKGEKRVQTGETASSAGGDVSVAPEKAFNDWTGGMATPWGASGPPHGAIGELWGKLSGVSAQDSAGSPLAVRSHNVDASIDGEVAITQVSTTYFNAGSSSVVGDFRMALPPTAVVSRYAIVAGGTTTEASLRVASPDTGNVLPKLEWAGEGWVRGSTSNIAPGDTITVIVRYVEWLSPAGDRMTYRYPMVSETGSPVIGEFMVKVDATGANPKTIAVGQGAKIEGAVVTLKKADFRPTADLVIEMGLAPNTHGPARAYASPPGVGDEGGDYVVIRTELPPVTSAAAGNNGVALAVVIDTSLSVDSALLDAERALVESLLEGLGARDRVIVLAGDHSTRAVGPEDLGSVTPERRKAVREALSMLKPGGATDLGIALQKAADMIPEDAPAGMVIYVGDGWPTLGDVRMDDIRARLARRAGGVPRLGAVAVGPLANRYGMSALVRGSGPVFEIADRADAAQVAVNLLAEALKPAIAGVEVDLGPDIERVYPRGARTVLAGGTFMVAGRVRGELPNHLKLRYRVGAKTEEVTRALFRPVVPDPGDVRRRWASARIEELALHNDSARGNEAAVDAAFHHRLLTPWTAWVIGSGSSSDVVRATPLSARVLDLSPTSTLASWFATPSVSFGTLVGSPTDPEIDPKEDDEEYKRAVASAARRTLEEAMEGVRACRASRAALRPEISGNLRVDLELQGDGHATKISVRSTTTTDNDDALNNCVSVIVTNMTFFASGLKTSVVVNHELRLPPPRDLKGRTCSAVSAVPLPLRRGVWLDRLQSSRELSKDYLYAKSRCELPTWTDRRVFLEMILDRERDGIRRVQIARNLEDAGEVDAASLIRKEAVRRASTAQELWQIRIALVGEERKALGKFRAEYRKANSDKDRLDIVRRFMKLAPHDAGLRRLVLVLLEAQNMKNELVAEIQSLRQDPFADASLLAEGASILRRLGDEAEARRAWGELIERAPNDPFAKAYVGDRLRDEGLYEDATAAYNALTTLVPDDPAATLRLALAHAGAGRLDVSSRILSRVTLHGGRRGDAKLGELASVLDAVLTAGERAKNPGPEDELRLARHALEIPVPDAAALVLVRSPSLDIPVETKVVRGKDKLETETAAALSSSSMGLSVLRVERGDKEVRIRLRRPAELMPHRKVKLKLDALVPGEDGSKVKLVTKDVELIPDGKPVDLHWDGAAWGG